MHGTPRVVTARARVAAYRGAMARMIVAEMCPQCGSLDVRATEPGWFRIEWDRRDALDGGWVEHLEFGCRDCGMTWD